MTGTRLSRRGLLLGGLGLATATSSAWALDRYVIDHPQVTAVSEQESGDPDTSSSATASSTIEVTTWIQGSGADLISGYIADVRLTDARLLRSAFADDTFGNNIIANPSVIAAQAGAELAINGDYYGFRDTGNVIRNGVAYRDQGVRIGLALDAAGTLRLYDETTTSAQALVDQQVWQAWSFGPGLVDGGQVLAGIEDFEVDTNFGNHSIQGAQPRTGIGMIEPNHFLFVVVDGRSPGYSRGITMTEFAELFASLGAQVAYNLDGGGSSAMIHNSQLVNNPLGKGRERGTSDIILIAGSGT